MLSTGRFIDATEAEKFGLINKVAPRADLEAETVALAQAVTEKLGAVVSIGKEAFYAQAEMELAEAYAYTGQVMAENMLMRDTNEGISAFLEKRTPDWSQ